MTDIEPQELESRVINNLQDMLAKYQKIDELADQMLTKQQQGNAIQQDLQSLQQQRVKILELEKQAKPDNAAYRNSRSTASAAVKSLTDQTTKVVQGLIGKVAQLEDAARHSYKQLFPEINQSLRGQQMKQAYGNTKS